MRKSPEVSEVFEVPGGPKKPPEVSGFCGGAEVSGGLRGGLRRPAENLLGRRTAIHQEGRTREKWGTFLQKASVERKDNQK